MLQYIFEGNFFGKVSNHNVLILLKKVVFTVNLNVVSWLDFTFTFYVMPSSQLHQVSL